VLKFTDAVVVVHNRGRFMQEATAPGVGKMAAVMGLGGVQVAEVCRDAAQGEVVAPANFNCPGQVVIAGNRDAVDRAVALAKERGASRAVPLPVSAPFHCDLMRPAAQRLDGVLREVMADRHRVPVVTNVEACANDDSSRVPKLLVDQVVNPVRWEESVRYMVEDGVGVMVEVGPKRVLSGLVKRIDRGVDTHQVEDVGTLKILAAACEKGP
jgi:[acyl-carrier-protein] S-malonyltransferase